jgi:ABC-type transport system involved in multi-copper enzyme maturation permease subunit
MSARPDELRGSVARILAVTRFSLREAIHGRSFIVGGVLSVAWLGIVVLLGWIGFSNIDAFMGPRAGDPQTEALVREVLTHFLVATAVGGLSFVAILITVFRGSGTIGGEIERGTILAVAARPVARPELVVGKIVGVVAVGAIVFTLLSAASVVAAGLLTGVWVAQAAQAILMLDLNLAIVGALAVAASVRFSPMVATISLLVTYFGITNIGLLYAFGVGARSETLQQAAIWGRLLLPVGEVSDAAGMLLFGPLNELTADLVRGANSGMEPRPWIVGYAVAYLAVAVLIGCIAFLRRDLR